MIKGNFSCNVNECLAMGKETFIKAHKGLYNGDLEELWNEISGEKPKKKKK